MDFCNRLKELREEKGLTQKDFAETLDISRATIAGYESQGKEPSFDRLKGFAKFFNVSVDYLVGYSDIKNTCDNLSCADQNKYSDLSKEDIIAIEKFEDYLRNRNK